MEEQMVKGMTMKEYMKIYRTNNMDKWKEQKTCEDCGSVYTSSNSSNHSRSRKHKYALMIKEDPNYVEEIVKKERKRKEVIVNLIKCDICGYVYKSNGIAKHLSSKKHKYELLLRENKKLSDVINNQKEEIINSQKEKVID